MTLLRDFVVLTAIGALLVIAPLFVVTLVLCIILVVLIDMYHTEDNNDGN